MFFMGKKKLVWMFMIIPRPLFKRGLFTLQLFCMFFMGKKKLAWMIPHHVVLYISLVFLCFVTSRLQIITVAWCAPGKVVVVSFCDLSLKPCLPMVTSSCSSLNSTLALVPKKERRKKKRKKEKEKKRKKKREKKWEKKRKKHTHATSKQDFCFFLGYLVALKRAVWSP